MRIVKVSGEILKGDDPRSALLEAVGKVTETTIVLTGSDPETILMLEEYVDAARRGKEMDSLYERIYKALTETVKSVLPLSGSSSCLAVSRMATELHGYTVADKVPFWKTYSDVVHRAHIAASLGIFELTKKAFPDEVIVTWLDARDMISVASTDWKTGIIEPEKSSTLFNAALAQLDTAKPSVVVMSGFVGTYTELDEPFVLKGNKVASGVGEFLKNFVAPEPMTSS